MDWINLAQHGGLMGSCKHSSIKRWDILREAEQLVASQDGLSSTELVIE
jgi:hypothetical protein